MLIIQILTLLLIIPFFAVLNDLKMIIMKQKCGNVLLRAIYLILIVAIAVIVNLFR